MPFSGFVIIIITTIMLKIWTLLPLIHIIIKFIGRLLDGAMAASHALATWMLDVSWTRLTGALSLLPLAGAWVSAAAYLRISEPNQHVGRIRLRPGVSQTHVHSLGLVVQRPRRKRSGRVHRR